MGLGSVRILVAPFKVPAQHCSRRTVQVITTSTLATGHFVSLAQTSPA